MWKISKLLCRWTWIRKFSTAVNIWPHTSQLRKSASSSHARECCSMSPEYFCKVQSNKRRWCKRPNTSNGATADRRFRKPSRILSYSYEISSRVLRRGSSLQPTILSSNASDKSSNKRAALVRNWSKCCKSHWRLRRTQQAIDNRDKLSILNYFATEILQQEIRLEHSAIFVATIFLPGMLRTPAVLFAQ